MTCVENVNKFIVPSDVIITLTKIYRLVGKNDKYKEISSWYNDKIIYQCLEKDIYYLSRLIELDISDNRARLLITKNSDARLKDEKVLLNIKEVLNAFSLNPKRQDISSSDLNNIINYVYSNSNQSIKYDNIKEERRNYYKKFTLGSKRDLIDKIYNFAKNNSNNIEPIIFTINYLIDLYGIQPFTQGNDTLCYLLLYLLLLKADIDAIRYVSLFEIIYNNKKEFKDAMNEALYNYNEGLPQVLSFTRFFTKLLLSIYEKCDEIMTLYEKEKENSKSDSIENVINHLNNIFTKDEIREMYPYVSESTINRALFKLKVEKIIKPLGKGRSARWIKIGIK